MGPPLTAADLGAMAKEAEMSPRAEQCPRRPPLGMINWKEKETEGRTRKAPRPRGSGAGYSGPGPASDRCITLSQFLPSLDLSFHL